MYGIHTQVTSDSNAFNLFTLLLRSLCEDIFIVKLMIRKNDYLCVPKTILAVLFLW